MPPRCSYAPPPSLIVITGLDPVIHASFGANPAVAPSDGRIKSGDDDRLEVHGKRPALAGGGFDTAAGAVGLAGDTTVPGVSRYWPRTTTVSPALRPLSISASPLSVSRTETGCIATL